MIGARSAQSRDQPEGGCGWRRCGRLRCVVTTLTTDDGVRIEAHHDPGPRTLGIVVAHGFTGSWRRPAVRRAATSLSRVGGVVSFDFRGHGRSDGLSTVGDREVRDLAAAVAWARALGYPRVATVGFSMGAAVAIRHAAGAASGDGAGGDGGAGPAGAGGDSAGGDRDALAAVVAVSGPSRWFYRDTPAMRRVHWVIEKRLGRLAGRVLRGTGSRPLKLATGAGTTGCGGGPDRPGSLPGRARRRGPAVPAEHAYALYAAARQRNTVDRARVRHAENAAGADLLHRIGAWLAATAGSSPRQGRMTVATPK